MIAVNLHSLTGVSGQYNYPDNTTIAHLWNNLQLKGVIHDFVSSKIIVNGKFIEEYGFATPILQLANEQSEISLMHSLNLASASYSFGKLQLQYRRACQDAIDSLASLGRCEDESELKKQTSIAVAKEKYAVILRVELDCMRKKYQLTSQSKTDSGMTWFQCGEIYSMEFSALKKYVAKNALLTSDGFQIPNPFVEVFIQRPIQPFSITSS